MACQMTKSSNGHSLLDPADFSSQKLHQWRNHSRFNSNFRKFRSVHGVRPNNMSSIIRNINVLISKQPFPITNSSANKLCHTLKNPKLWKFRIIGSSHGDVP
ncbi:hypothetical protein IC582_018203 [Cucumis melo]